MPTRVPVSLCRFRLLAAVGLLGALTPAMTGTAQVRPAEIRGRLVDDASGAALTGALVHVLGLGRTTQTDSLGRFAHPGIPPGTYLLQVRAIGYTSAAWALVLAEGEIIDEVFRLQAGYEMDPLVVEGIADQRLAEFEARRQEGRGHFVTAEEIRASGATRLSDVLRTTPGVRLMCRGSRCQVRMMRAPRECQPDYVVDGHPATFSTSPEMSLVGVIAIEVYRTLSETPLQFLRSDNQCGTVVIWTKSG